MEEIMEVRVHTTPNSERLISEIKAQAAEQGTRITKAKAITLALEMLHEINELKPVNFRFQEI